MVTLASNCFPQGPPPACSSVEFRYLTPFDFAWPAQSQPLRLAVWSGAPYGQCAPYAARTLPHVEDEAHPLAHAVRRVLHRFWLGPILARLERPGRRAPLSSEGERDANCPWPMRI